MGRPTLSAWLPDRTPTWTDILLPAIAGGWLALNLVPLKIISWGIVTGGFVLALIAYGSIANSSTGVGIGKWARKHGIAGRILMVLFGGIGVVGLLIVIVPSNRAITSFVGGIALASLVYVLAHVATAGEVNGW